MRAKLADEVEAGRVAGERGWRCGAFRLRHPLTRVKLNVIASDGAEWQEAAGQMPGLGLAAGGRDMAASGPWEHVSVSMAHERRCPTWEEMCWVKGLFWAEDEWVIQYHPAAESYVNQHPGVLHLWRPADGAFPVPPRVCV